MLHHLLQPSVSVTLRRTQRRLPSHLFLFCHLRFQEFEHHKHILNIKKDHFAHMNNTAERAGAGQPSHPLPLDGHKTNALPQDEMRPGLVCKQNWPADPAWFAESCFSVLPNHLSKPLRMQRPGSTFVMTTCFRHTRI